METLSLNKNLIELLQMKKQQFKLLENLNLYMKKILKKIENYLIARKELKQNLLIQQKILLNLWMSLKIPRQMAVSARCCVTYSGECVRRLQK